MSKVTAIISGASRGIGFATVTELISRGWHVIGLSRNAPVEPPKRGYTHIQCDLSNVTSIQTAWDGVLATSKSLDLSIGALVNSAGATHSALLLRSPDSTFQDMFNVNVVGTVALSRHYSRYILQTKVPGSIVCVGSVVASTGNEGQTAYAASKGALIGETCAPTTKILKAAGFAKSLAKELGPIGARVNVIEPGFIDTGMTAPISDVRKQAIIDRTSLKRFGQPVEVAKLAAFLASQESSFVTGQVIRVCGGLSL